MAMAPLLLLRAILTHEAHNMYIVYIIYIPTRFGIYNLFKISRLILRFYSVIVDVRLRVDDDVKKSQDLRWTGCS